MKTRYLALTATFLALLAGSVLVAGDNNRQGKKDEDQGTRMFRSSQLTGLNVRANKSEENLAHIDDIVINLADGHVAYYAIAYGRVIGFGGHLVAVAPEAMHIQADKDNRPQYFTLNATKADLENAKGFDSNNWPQHAQFGGHKGGTKNEGTPGEKLKEGVKEIKEGVREGVENVKEGLGGKGMEQHLTRVSALMNTGVRNPNGDNLGSIFDLVIDANNNKVCYAGISHGGTAGIGGKLYAMPWRALELKSLNLRPGSRVFVVNATSQEFDNAHGFTSGGDWPTTPDPAFKAIPANAGTK
jgi:sporulation protein YlmC with PRC-barrel domain